MDDKSQYKHLPIPTYEEATSSRPASAQSRLGPEEISDDAERQGLLRSSNNYRPPTVESARPSLDSLDGMGHDDEDEVRREMQQMDMEDPLNDSSVNRSLLRYRLSKRLTSFTNSFNSFSLPSVRSYLSNIRWPQINYQQLDANRVVILGRLFGIFLIMGVLYVLIASDVLSFTKSRMGQTYDPDSVKIFVQNHMNDHGHIQKYLEHITGFPHVAGTEGNYVLGEWVAELFKAGELEDVEMEKYEVYLNYPRKDGRRVAIVEPETLRWEAKIEEDQEQDLVFHGHSKSGDVTGPLLYANFGAREDFKKLEDEGISVKGAIVLVRYYGTQGDRALKVRAAELAGAAGCIIYSDPSQDGFVKGPTYPDGRFMPADAVQRGAVSLMSWVVGDVLTPGWASTPENDKRLQPDDSPGLNKIPSIAISWNDAKHLLEALKGQGKWFRDLDTWAGVPDFEYWTGTQDSPKVNLKNIQDEAVAQPIYNVIGKITGWEEPNKRIIIGNHRDAWCTGAADPGSGTAIMLELIRVFGELRRLGWRPLRTIEFASWDGEEYNLIGSTEHVENRVAELREDGVAYLNVDVGVTGSDFYAAASPMFEHPLMHAINRVGDPTAGKSIREIWDGEARSMGRLGAGSDFVAFQDIAGTSSIDMSFKGAEFPYHSCYDNFDWMAKFGDPDWTYHKAMGEIWGLLVLGLADEPILPFHLPSYSQAIARYIDELESYTKSIENHSLDVTPLRQASDLLNQEAQRFHQFDSQWRDFVLGSGGFESSAMGTARKEHNNRLALFETHLLDLSEGGGLANRTQFKHVISAPQAWSGYDDATFPGVRDAIDAGDWDLAQQEVMKVAAIVETATGVLNAPY